MLFQNSNTRQVLDNATHITDVVTGSIDNLLTSIVAQLPYVVAGLVVLVIFWFLSQIVKKVFSYATRRTHLDQRLRILFSRLLVTFVIILGIFTALTVVVPSFAFGDFIAGLGLTSLAIGFATKDILNHLISGVLILWQQPFRIGDFISVKGHDGWVNFIGVRATSLRKTNGEVILIPNGDIYSSPLTVRRAGASYPMSLKFDIGYVNDIPEAKRITRATLTESEKIVDNPPPEVVISDVAGTKIAVTADFRIDSHESKPEDVFDEAASKVLASLAAAGIEVFPTSPA